MKVYVVQSYHGFHGVYKSETKAGRKAAKVNLELTMQGSMNTSVYITKEKLKK